MVDRIPLSPPIIQPIPVEEGRPLWSVMIPVYNCASYLPEALQSVLMQGFSSQEMQIEVIDDASTDADIEEIVSRIGQGRVSYYRQTANVGSLRNFETCINRSRGKLVHILHGDDRVRKGFYEKLGSLFRLCPEAGAAFCRYSYIDPSGTSTFNQGCEMEAEGVLQNWLVRIAQYQRIQYVSMAVRREVYERVGGFYGITYGEDWEMWVRIAKHYPVAYTPEILADYRRHPVSISGQKLQNGQLLKDIEKAIAMIQQHLPAENRKMVSHVAKKYYSNFAIIEANLLWQSFHEKHAVRAQIRQVLLTCRRLDMVWKCFKLYLKTTLPR